MAVIMLSQEPVSGEPGVVHHWIIPDDHVESISAQLTEAYGEASEILVPAESVPGIVNTYNESGLIEFQSGSD